MKEEAYMFEGGSFIHLKEKADGGFHFEAFAPGKLRMVDNGEISKEQVDRHPARNPMEAALNIAIDQCRDSYFGWFARVSVNMLLNFADSDIIKRGVCHPDTLPDDDIPFLDGEGHEMFRIPNGGSILVEYPGKSISFRCEHVDSLHVRIDGDVYHVSGIDEVLAEHNADCRPNPEVVRYEGAWKIGCNRYLTVQACDTGWDYTIYEQAYHEVDGGQIDDTELSILEACDQILIARGMENLGREFTSFFKVKEYAEVAEHQKTADPCSCLYEKMSAEQSAYREWLLTLPPEEILHHTCEYSVREDILLAMEENDLSADQAVALLRSPSPLADIYESWCKRCSETDYMSDVWQTVEDRAETVLNRA